LVRPFVALLWHCMDHEKRSDSEIENVSVCLTGHGMWRRLLILLFAQPHIYRHPRPLAPDREEAPICPRRGVRRHSLEGGGLNTGVLNHYPGSSIRFEGITFNQLRSGGCGYSCYSMIWSSVTKEPKLQTCIKGTVLCARRTCKVRLAAGIVVLLACR
jgi:hypothetical protein